MKPRAVGVVAMSLSLVLGCAPTVLPPPQVPEQVLPPDVTEAPTPSPGEGQITIAADEPSKVEVVTGTYEGVDGDGSVTTGLTYATVCPATPCAANLPLGAHQLQLTSLTDPEHYGAGAVTIDAQPSAYRYALGHNVPGAFGHQFLGAYLLTEGGLSLIGGAVLIGIGRTSSSDDFGMSMPSVNFRPYGVGMMVAGAAVVYLAWRLMRGTNGASQDGAGVQWTP